MKNIHITIALIFMVITGCSKQQDNAVPMPQTIDAMQKTMPELISAELSNVVQDNSGKIVRYWYDPMMVDKHFTKPGKSPFMDMQLEPKYAEDVNKGGQP